MYFWFLWATETMNIDLILFCFWFCLDIVFKAPYGCHFSFWASRIDHQLRSENISVLRANADEERTARSLGSGCWLSARDWLMLSVMLMRVHAASRTHPEHVKTQDACDGRKEAIPF